MGGWVEATIPCRIDAESGWKAAPRTPSDEHLRKIHGENSWPLRRGKLNKKEGVLGKAQEYKALILQFDVDET